MNKKCLEEVEFEQTLNNFKTLEELEFFKAHPEDRLQKLEVQEKIEEFKLKLDMLEIEQGSIVLDKEKVIEKMREDGSILEYVGSRFQNDYDVVLEAVKTYEWALYYASKELQDDYEIVFQALKLNPKALEYASHTLKREEKFIKIYINYWVGDNKIYKNVDEFIRLHELFIDEELIQNLFCS